MSDPFSLAIGQSFSRAESGEPMDLVVGDDGMTMLDFQVEQQFPGAQDQTNPFSIAGEVEPMTVGEFGQKVGATAAGAATGAVTSTLGAPGDIAGVISGGIEAAQAPEGKGLEAFLTELVSVSEQYGSEALLQGVAKVVNELPISEEMKKDFFAGSKYLGEFGEIPGAGLAVKAGVKTGKDLIDIIQTSAAQSARKDVPFPFDQLPDRTTITPDEQSLWEEQSKAFKFSQPVTTAEDAMEAARRNQQVLGGMGRTIANSTGAKFKNPGIKGETDAGKRLAEKSAQKGGVRSLTDITRSGFTVDSVQQAEEVVDMLAANYKIIDEGYNVTSLGYFDRKVLLINQDGQIGEVQIWPSSAMFDAKLTKGGQDLYGIVRGSKTPDQMNAEELAEYKKIVKKYKLQGDTHDEIVADATEKSLDLYADGIKGSSDEMQQIAIDRLKEIAAEGGDESASAVAMLERLGEATQ